MAKKKEKENSVSHLFSSRGTSTSTSSRGTGFKILKRIFQHLFSACFLSLYFSIIPILSQVTSCCIMLHLQWQGNCSDPWTLSYNYSCEPDLLLESHNHLCSSKALASHRSKSLFSLNLNTDKTGQCKFQQYNTMQSTFAEVYYNHLYNILT